MHGLAMGCPWDAHAMPMACPPAICLPAARGMHTIGHSSTGCSWGAQMWSTYSLHDLGRFFCGLDLYCCIQKHTQSHNGRLGYAV